MLLAHTHDVHQTSPRLAFLSPVPECGKTTALSVLRGLVPRALPTSNITPAVIFRVIEQRQPTLLIDEADTFMQGDDMRGILNSGHTRATAQVWRCEGDSREPKGFSTWAPVAIAKIGDLPETLESRSIVIPMQRRRPDERKQPVGAEDRQAFADLASTAARWAADHGEALADANPDLPAGLFNGTRDNWRPLIAIADAARGHWPERARRVAVLLSGSAEDPSLGIQLLSDIREILRTERLSSEDLCEDLRGLEDRPWTEDGIAINPRQLARLLKPFGIAPKSVRSDPAPCRRGTPRRSSRTPSRGIFRRSRRQPQHRHKPEKQGFSAPAIRNTAATVAQRVADRRVRNPQKSSLVAVLRLGPEVGEISRTRDRRVLPSNTAPADGTTIAGWDSKPLPI